MKKVFESWKIETNYIWQIMSIEPFPILFHLNKHDRIKRNTSMRKLKEGGIGVMDIELKLKAPRHLG